ncbi:MAG: Gfo/Idh/MocA family oxidoreductase [Lentisphaerae bacterium]|nr:Gfo/Idh/MocA family oxidoreductase [Lentisphaerota bacterium]
MSSYCCVVVGAGGISQVWFKALVQESVAVKAVVDLQVEAARRRIQEFNLEAEPSDNLKAMLKKHRPDFVLDLTVPEAHAAVTCAALRMGCHVIGEKPMASDMTAARRMVKLAEKTGRLYMVSQSRRREARNEALRSAAASGAIGRLTTVNCDFYIGAHFGGFRDTMASPLILDMAIHHFDLARFFSGADPVAVYAREFNPRGSWYRGDVAATCVFEMSDGLVFTYRGSWCAEGCPTSWNGDWRLIGDKGTLICERDQPPRGQGVNGTEGFIRPLKDLDIPVPPLPAEGYHAGLREMLEFLKTGQKPQTECHDNIRSLAMVFAAIESSRKGRRVPVRSI